MPGAAIHNEQVLASIRRRGAGTAPAWGREGELGFSELSQSERLAVMRPGRELEIQMRKRGAVSGTNGYLSDVRVHAGRLEGVTIRTIFNFEISLTADEIISVSPWDPAPLRLAVNADGLYSRTQAGSNAT